MTMAVTTWLHVNTYMGGNIEDVKRLFKKWDFTLYTLGILDHLHLCCLKIIMCFKQLEAKHIRSCDS